MGVSVSVDRDSSGTSNTREPISLMEYRKRRLASCLDTVIGGNIHLSNVEGSFLFHVLKVKELGGGGQTVFRSIHEKLYKTIADLSPNIFERLAKSKTPDVALIFIADRSVD